MWKSKVVSAVVSVVVCLCMSFSVFAQENTKSDVLASWHFDEGEGQIAKDSSGNSNDLRLSGTLWVEGKKGKCLSFNGENSYAYAKRVSDSLASLGDEFTISVWIKPDYVYIRGNSKSPTDMWIVSCIDHARGPGYMFFIDSACLVFRSGEGNPTRKYWGISAPKFKEGKIPEKVLKKGSWYGGQIHNRWYHLAVTYKDGTYRIYVDGSLAVEKKEKGVVPGKGRLFVSTCTLDMKNAVCVTLLDSMLEYVSGPAFKPTFQV